MLAINLRGAPSGPVLDGGNAGDVVTKNADGSVSFAAPAGGGLTSFNGRNAPAVIPTAGDYDASEIPNDGNAPGASIADAATILADRPTFKAETDNGNSGATPVVSFGVGGPAQKITLTANATASITGFTVNRTAWLQLKVIQGGVGSFTLAITGAKTPGGAGLTLSTAVGAQDLINVYYDGTTLYAAVAGLAFA